MWKKTTTKVTYTEQAGSEECMCRVKETGKFIGLEVSKYKIETVAFQIMQWRETKAERNCCIVRISRKSMENAVIYYTLNKHLILENKL